MSSAHLWRARMNVASIMTSRVVTVEMDDTLLTMLEIFDHVKFHHILVVEDQKLVGVISDRDLLKWLCPWLGVGRFGEKQCSRSCLGLKAHRIMSRNPITAFMDTGIKTAARLLLKNNISCLPIVSTEGTIEGIVTWKDILNLSLKNEKF